MKYFSYPPSLPFTFSIKFLIPFQSFVYFFTTSLFSSVEAKNNYLIPLFSSMYLSTSPTVKYNGFTNN